MYIAISKYIHVLFFCNGLIDWVSLVPARDRGVSLEEDCEHDIVVLYRHLRPPSYPFAVQKLQTESESGVTISCTIV